MTKQFLKMGNAQPTQDWHPRNERWDPRTADKGFTETWLYDHANDDLDTFAQEIRQMAPLRTGVGVTLLFRIFRFHIETWRRLHERYTQWCHDGMGYWSFEGPVSGADDRCTFGSPTPFRMVAAAADTRF